MNIRLDAGTIGPEFLVVDVLPLQRVSNVPSQFLLCGVSYESQGSSQGGWGLEERETIVQTANTDLTKLRLGMLGTCCRYGRNYGPFVMSFTFPYP